MILYTDFSQQNFLLLLLKFFGPSLRRTTILKFFRGHRRNTSHLTTRPHLYPWWLPWTCSPYTGSPTPSPLLNCYMRPLSFLL